MKTFVSAFKFIRRNIFRDPEHILRYAWRYFDPEYKLPVRFMDNSELLNQIHQGKSMIRLGDGEIYLINYGNIHYQKYHPRLREYLLKIIRDYDAKAGCYLLGMPQEWLGKSNREIKAKQMLRIWLPVKLAFERYFRSEEPYFDAHLFYRSGAFERLLGRILESHEVIWVANPANIDLIKNTGVEQRLRVKFVNCPASNAFEQFDELLQQIIQLVEPGAEGRYRVLLSAGPASKALVYELSKRNIVSYDLGKGIEAVYRPSGIEHEIYERPNLAELGPQTKKVSPAAEPRRA